jgi:hypothetical protein
MARLRRLAGIGILVAAKLAERAEVKIRYGRLRKARLL